MIKLLRDRTVLLALAAITLGAALQVRNGLYSPLAVGLLACAVAFAFGAVAGTPRAGAARGMIVYPIFIFAVLVFTVIGARVLRSTPSPFMDVFVFQRDACVALLDGINPYSITYPNIYAGPGSFVYDRTLVSGDRLLFGFPYMPLTLWFDLVGHVALGDYRVMNLLAIAMAAACVVAIDGSLRSLVAALLLLFTPRVFFILEHGWTEPMTVLLLAATVLAASHFPRAL